MRYFELMLGGGLGGLAKVSRSRPLLRRNPLRTKTVENYRQSRRAWAKQIAKETGLSRQTVYRIRGDLRQLRLHWLLGGL